MNTVVLNGYCCYALRARNINLVTTNAVEYELERNEIGNGSGCRIRLFCRLASWAVMCRCDGNEPGVRVGVGVGQEPTVEVGVGVGTAPHRLRNSGRGPVSETESPGVMTTSQESESESDSAPRATSRLRNPASYHTILLTHRMLRPYHTMFLTICFLPPAANEGTGFAHKCAVCFQVPLTQN